MKIKYKMINQNHPTHLYVGDLTMQQFSTIIEFLEFNNIDWEYTNGK